MVGRVLQQPRVLYETKVPTDTYMYKSNVTLTLASSTSINDTTITVVDATGAAIGNIITMYERKHIYQSFIKNIVSNTITLSSPIDYAFTSSSIIEAGIYNMNVDGSVTPVTFIAKGPPACCINLHTLNISMLDASVMGDGKWGGMDALTNGVVFRFQDGITKNLMVAKTNLELEEMGFSNKYADKPPADKYGLSSSRNLAYVSGTTLLLNSGGASEFQVIIQDDLRNLDKFACSLNGYFGG